MANDQDTRTDAEKAAAVDRIFEEAGFEFEEQPEGEQTSATFVVAPLRRERQDRP